VKKNLFLRLWRLLFRFSFPLPCALTLALRIKKNFYALVLAIIILNSVIGCSKNDLSLQNEKRTSEKNIYSSVISLAPSLTEIMYVIEADSALAGVTEFCVYPESAKLKPKIGGYVNLNFEQLMILKPDLILALPAHRDNFSRFDQMKIPYKVFSQKTVSDVRESILGIGILLGKKEKAENFLKIFDAEFSKKNIVENSKRPKVLIIVGREFGHLKNAVCAGRKTFYNDLIEYAGGVNAAPESDMEYNSVNAESIVSMNPDIIIEIFAPHSGMIAFKDENLLRKDWDIFPKVNAIKNNKVYYIIKDYATLPGPRLYLLYRDIKHIIYK